MDSDLTIRASEAVKESSVPLVTGAATSIARSSDESMWFIDEELRQSERRRPARV